MQQNPSPRLLQEIEGCESQASEEFDKVNYVLELFDTVAEELKEKVIEGKQVFRLSKDCIDDYLAIQTHNHPAQSMSVNGGVESSSPQKKLTSSLFAAASH